MDYGKRPPLDEQKSLWEATIAAEGITTSAGEGSGLSFIAAGLAGAGVNSFISMMAVIHPGDPTQVDSRDVTVFDNGTGEVTVASAFKGGQVVAGVPYKIVTFRFVPAEVAAILALVDSKVMGRSQIFEKSITSAANVGDVTVATITTQPCLIESIVIHADAAQTGDMTSCGVFGGAGKVITFISAADAVQGQLDAEDKQVAWRGDGVVRLAATKTIVISLVGTGATAVDLTIVIKYRACVSGGYLA